MNGENQPLVTNDRLKVQDIKKINDPFKRIYGIYLKLVKRDHSM